jgi:hypothetical protein
VDSDDCRICVGYFDSGGLNILSDWDDLRNSRLGLSSVKKVKF